MYLRRDLTVICILWCISPTVFCQQLTNNQGGIICNVAYQRQTTSSSVYVSAADDFLGGYSCNGVDGSTSQDYFQKTCVHTRQETNPWWEVDLGAIYIVKNISLYVRRDHQELSHYTEADNVKITVDGLECNQYYGPTTLDSDPVHIYCLNGAVRGRVLRMTKIIDSGYLQFCEIKVNALVSASTCPGPTQSWSCRDLVFTVTNSLLETTTITTDSPLEITTITTDSPLETTTITTDSPLETTTITTDSPLETTTITTDSPLETTTITTDSPLETTTISSNSYLSTTTSSTSETTSSTSTTTSFTSTITSLLPTGITQTQTGQNMDCWCPCSTVGSNVLMNLTMVGILAKLDELVNDIKIDATKTTLSQSKRISAKDDRPSAKAVGYVGMAIIIGVGAGLVLLDVDIFVRFLKQVISSRKR